MSHAKHIRFLFAIALLIAIVPFFAPLRKAVTVPSPAP